MNVDVHVFHHLDDTDSRRVNEKLDHIVTQLAGLIAQGAKEMQELDTLKTKVQETTTVEQSAIELLNGLGAQIAALKEDPAALQALSDQLTAKSSELASAVTANTPAA